MKKLLYFFLPLLALVACTEGGVDDSNSGNSNNNQNQEGAKPSIILTQNEYTVSDEGETIAVEVKSGVDVGVEILDNVQWVSRVSSRAMSAMTYYFKVEQNDTHENREARIKFFNRENNLEEIVTINQMQKDAIVLAQSSYSVGSEGGKIDIEVGHNVDFDIQITGDWISNASTRAFETETLTFNIAANTAETSREGMIKFVSEDGRITQTVTIVQNPFMPTPAANEIRVKIKGQDALLHSKVADSFGSNVSSIKQDGEWYVITLQDGYTTIPDAAFAGVSWLIEVVIPNGVISIGDSAFCGCTCLTSFYGKFASGDNRCLIFDGILKSFAPAGLTSYTIPDGITSIGDSAFESCENLSNIIIPNSVTEIGEAAFRMCYSLKSMAIPNSVTLIGEYAFGSCHSLTSITIPDSVTSIGSSAFYGCTSLTSMTIPDSVTSIGHSAFCDCYSLKSVTIPDSVTSIGKWAFYDCTSLTSITIPDSVTSIGSYAFCECSSLKEVYCKPVTPPMIEYNVFDGKFGNKIYVPVGSLDDYKNHPDWSYYKSVIEGYYF